MTKYNLHDKRIWLTGASSGIGAEIAKQLLQYNCKLIVSGRNIVALQTLAQLDSHNKPLVIPFDITHKSAHFEAVELIKKHCGGLDVVIFNAGACDFYDPKNFSSEVCEHLINTNFLSVVYGIEAVLPLLRASANAMIVAISSIAAYDGLPFGMGGYCASKAALSVFFKSLAMDVYHENIHTLLVSPGFVNTPLATKNPFSMPCVISPQQAALKIIHSIEKKRFASHFPKKLSIAFSYASRLPRSILIPLMSRIQPYLSLK